MDHQLILNQVLRLANAQESIEHSSNRLVHVSVRAATKPKREKAIKIRPLIARASLKKLVLKVSKLILMEIVSVIQPKFVHPNVLVVR